MSPSSVKDKEPDAHASVMQHGPASVSSLAQQNFQNEPVTFCAGVKPTPTASIEGCPMQPPDLSPSASESEAARSTVAHSPPNQHGRDAQGSSQSEDANGSVCDDKGDCTAPDDRPQSPMSLSARATYATSMCGTCSECSVQNCCFSPEVLEAASSEDGDTENTSGEGATATAQPQLTRHDTHAYYAGFGAQFGSREEAEKYKTKLEVVDVNGDSH